jgi:hypothetical protein
MQRVAAAAAASRVFFLFFVVAPPRPRVSCLLAANHACCYPSASAVFLSSTQSPADTKIVTSPTRLWKSSLANSRPWYSSVPYLSFSLQTLETHRVSWGDCPSPTQVSILMQFFASFPTLAPCKPLPKCLASRHRVEKGIQQETAVSRQCLS